MCHLAIFSAIQQGNDHHGKKESKKSYKGEKSAKSEKENRRQKKIRSDYYDLFCF